MKYLNMTEILGVKEIEDLKSPLQLIELSEKGIPTQSIFKLANWLDIPIKQIAGMVHISPRTLQRYSLKKKLEISIAEHILQITRVAVKGMEVFESKGKFLNWMNSSSSALGQKTPLSFLNTCLGVEMVLNELIRIEHGIFS